MSEILRREEIVSAARTWLGTPYHHQASVKGVGCDCVGLIRGVWRECIGPEPVKPPPYSRDWGEANGTELMQQFFIKYLHKIALADAASGDVVCMRWKPGVVAKHCLILTDAGKAIHSLQTVPVTEFHLSEWWREKFVAAFKFPRTA